MSRILAIDYGLRRTGLAVSDPLRIIAQGLATVETQDLMRFLKDYAGREPVGLILVGEPKNLDDSDTHASGPVRDFIKRLRKELPQVDIQTIDERFSSKMASRAMIEMGMKKKDRREKGNIDQIAATMLLQEYMQSHPS